jgi:HEAT repeats
MCWQSKFGSYSCSFSLGLLLNVLQILAVPPQSLAQNTSSKAVEVESICTVEQINTLIRWWHINNLGIQKNLSLCGKSATPHLIQVLLIDQNVWRRQNAARFLGELKSTASTQALMNAIQTDQNEIVRQYAAVSLVQINGSETIGTLFLDIWFSRSEYSRARIVDVFSKLPSPEVLPNLIAALSSQSFDVRYLAVEILANSRSELAMHALEKNKEIVSKTLEQRNKISIRQRARTLWWDTINMHPVNSRKVQKQVQQRIPQKILACRWDWFAKIWQSC